MTAPTDSQSHNGQPGMLLGASQNAGRVAPSGMSQRLFRPLRFSVNSGAPLMSSRSELRITTQSLEFAHRACEVVLVEAHTRGPESILVEGQHLKSYDLVAGGVHEQGPAEREAVAMNSDRLQLDRDPHLNEEAVVDDRVIAVRELVR